MYHYSIFQWIAFFIIYCFIGWVFESVYVSIEHKKWVNRGFMNGPFLPIYGFGAIIMLFAALPVRVNLFLIFLFGMLAATALEYFTGWAIEKIFKTRYWDYTYQPFNVDGYICLGCSLMWGVCAIVLLKFLHGPAEKIVLGINSTALIVADGIFLCYFLWDMYVSVRQAIDLRKVITEYIRNNEELQRLQKRVDVLIAFMNEDKENFQNKLEARKAEREEKREEIRAELDALKADINGKREAFHEKIHTFQHRARKVLKRNPSVHAKRQHLTFDELKELITKR